jgi:hypothetical protein
VWPGLSWRLALCPSRARRRRRRSEGAGTGSEPTGEQRFRDVLVDHGLDAVRRPLSLAIGIPPPPRGRVRRLTPVPQATRLGQACSRLSSVPIKRGLGRETRWIVPTCDGHQARRRPQNLSPATTYSSSSRRADAICRTFSSRAQCGVFRIRSFAGRCSDVQSAHATCRCFRAPTCHLDRTATR